MTDEERAYGEHTSDVACTCEGCIGPVVDPSGVFARDSADAVWRWLLACLRCGREHVWRPVHDCSCDAHKKHPTNVGGMWTWADPHDGHAYERRESVSQETRQQWRDAIAATSASAESDAS